VCVKFPEYKTKDHPHSAATMPATGPQSYSDSGNSLDAEERLRGLCLSSNGGGGGGGGGDRLTVSGGGIKGRLTVDNGGGEGLERANSEKGNGAERLAGVRSKESGAGSGTKHGSIRLKRTSSGSKVLHKSKSAGNLKKRSDGGGSTPSSASSPRLAPFAEHLHRSESASGKVRFNITSTLLPGAKPVIYVQNRVHNLLNHNLVTSTQLCKSFRAKVSTRCAFLYISHCVDTV
jgi:hypothetical protein